MIHKRHLAFWIAILLAFVFLLWLLSGILLPFVAGLALAYLQTPLADWLERRGMNRTLAALLIIGTVVLIFILLALLLAPILAEQAAALIAAIPKYGARIQTLVSDSGRRGCTNSSTGAIRPSRCPNWSRRARATWRR